MKKFRRWAKTAQAASPLIFGGDLNIAHTESDIFYAKSNEKTSGFLPHERQWFGQLLKSGWHDLVREHYGNVRDPIRGGRIADELVNWIVAGGLITSLRIRQRVRSSAQPTFIVKPLWR